LDIRLDASLETKERSAYRGCRNMYGMYVRKNKIPPAAAPEFAEIIKYWYFVTFSKMTCGKNMQATLQNNKAT